MAEELSYVIVNPYTLAKGRLGGILTRLLTQTSLDLVSAQIFAPSQALVDDFEKLVLPSDSQDPQAPVIALLRQYVVENYSPCTKSGLHKRVVVLLFKGENAIDEIRRVVGAPGDPTVRGVTIRDTFGDFLLNDDGSVKYFEPAVLVAPNAKEVQEKLAVWAKYADSDAGVLENVLPGTKEEGYQRTLIIVKPDNFTFNNGRFGNILDFFTRAGLKLTGIKVQHLSIAQGNEFYGPVLEVLKEKLGAEKGEKNYNDILEFMTGRNPVGASPEEVKALGTSKSVVLIVEGVDAVKKIRDILGPTNPANAPAGTIRKEFGTNIMVNACHASDSAENAQREMGIVKIRDNNFKSVIENFYKGQGAR